MNTSSNKDLHQSRRDFLVKGSISSLGLLITGSSAFSNPFLNVFNPDSKFSGVQIGVITYSYRSMPGDVHQILKYVVDSGINAVELMGDAVEEFAGKPINPVKITGGQTGQRPALSEDQKTQLAAYAKQVAEWRAAVPMDKFAALKKIFKKAGVSIYAYKPNALNPSNSDAEIEYALKAARALGARSVTVELPTDVSHSKRLGDLAAKHKVYIGYHAHTQATDTAWDTALSQSAYNSFNLDCGHYIAAGGDNTKQSLLKLIENRHDRITSLHLKDRKTKENGAANLLWGQGDTPIVEVLTLLKEKKYKIPVSIELEYEIPEGSDAVKETQKCLAYAKKALGA